ncbi:MAG: hypothetical protein WCV83_02115 [Candidatus Magasanikbacteria bacterium]|jgi:hypothetical protein
MCKVRVEIKRPAGNGQWIAESAKAMASLLERAGFEGVFRARFVTKIRPAPSPGISIRMAEGPTAVLVWVQASTDRNSRASFHLIVPPGLRAEEFFQQLKKAEETVEQKSEHSPDVEVERVADEADVVSVEEDELIAEACNLVDEMHALEPRYVRTEAAAYRLQLALNDRLLEDGEWRRRKTPIITPAEVEIERGVIRELDITMEKLRSHYQTIRVRLAEIEKRLQEMRA